MADTALSPAALSGLAFAIAALLGAVGQKTGFCTMGAVADIVHMNDWSRMRSWCLAMAVALLGSTALHALGWIDLGKSLYRAPALPWLSHLLGGLCFGAGMVLASGCGFRTLIRLGGGNLKSLVVLIVLGLTALMTLRGILAVPRAGGLDPVAVTFAGGQDIPALLAAAGLSPGPALWLPTLVLGGGLLLFALAKRDVFTLDHLLGGLTTGLAVVALWYVSGHLGHLAEDPDTLQEAFLATNSGRMESLSFVGPVAYTLDWLMLWSDNSRKLTLGIAAVLGVFTGAAAWALMTQSFRWQGFRDAADTARHLIGGALMGFGGVTAMGCTIGQGISGLSTLALGSILSLLAIIAGAVLTLRLQYRFLAKS